jgi:uncharacterized protein (DUF488 family)
VVVFTIGHSTRTADELVGLLVARDVTLLVDVRRYPGSRRFPRFNGEALAARLEADGIAYRHAPVLGGRRSGLPDSPNTGWRNASFRAYADHLGTPAFRAALDHLLELARGRTVALMCAEAVPWRCHRNLIADALVARGVEVRHITGPSDPDRHALNPMARVAPDGTVTYPAPPPVQGGLFEA